MADSILPNIQIKVLVSYSPQDSAPHKGLWYFIYQVEIKNHGPEPARLITRHWQIANAEGTISEVHGPGVVGKQPHILPGESFQYTSACPLDSPFGSMSGSYTMITDSGKIFEAPIPAFSLAQPHAIN